MKKPSKSAAQPQPTKDEFVKYAQTKEIDARAAGDQWEIWDAQNWCDANGTAILNWKGKLLTFAKGGFGVFSKLGLKREEREDVAHRRVLTELERRNRQAAQERRLIDEQGA